MNASAAAVVSVIVCAVVPAVALSAVATAELVADAAAGAAESMAAHPDSAGLPASITDAIQAVLLRPEPRFACASTSFMFAMETTV